MAKDIYQEIIDRGVITEREINLCKNRLNRGVNAWPVMAGGALDITPEQTKKGFEWLWDKYKTPRGAIRKHNPFKMPQIAILEHFDHFELVDFQDYGNWFTRWFLPVYRVYSKSGLHFDYVAKYSNKMTPITIL